MSDEPTERDRLTEEMCALTPNWGQAERIARAVLTSDWYAECLAQARREGAEHEQAGWLKYEVERETSEVLRHRAVSIEQAAARLETAMLALSDEWTGQQSSGVKIHCGRRLRTALTTALRGDHAMSINFALRCGRLDMHDAHEWTRPREPDSRRTTYWCNGAPVTEGGWTRCPGCATSGRPHDVGGVECGESAREKAISQGDE